MYSFSQRQDCKVYDEPLYAAYLESNPEIFRPYRDELIQISSTDPNDVLINIQSDTCRPSALKYVKHMAKHLTKEVNRDFIFRENTQHMILVRDPLEMIRSWNIKQEIHQEPCSLEATCLPTLLTIFSEVRTRTGSNPIVVDVNLLQKFPDIILQEICLALRIDFDPKQLSWPKGPKPDIDGYACDENLLNLSLPPKLGCGPNIGMSRFTNLRGSGWTERNLN